MQVGTIYLIINKVNGHKYIGQTTQTTNKAWKQHIEDSKRMSPDPLHRAMRKYGAHQFLMKELEECNTNKLDERVEHFIKEYNTTEGYNTCLLYTSPSPRDRQKSRMPSSA